VELGADDVEGERCSKSLTAADIASMQSSAARIVNSNFKI